jgi:ABC-type uncharacterized transport system ATPase subunit
MTGETENTTTAGTPVPAVVMSGISKAFPGVIANADVDLEIRAGEVHALLGENGAGKSTLSNVLTGLYRPDAGTIRVNGELVDFSAPRDAIAAGIGMVHQHFRLVPTFTVAENVALGERGRFRRRDAERRVGELARRYQMPVDPTAKVWQLSVGEQQRVEIIKVLARDARVLILDEPTAVLTPQEATTLFTTLRAFAAEGRAVLFISHKLDEVMAVSDRVTVLRDARNVGTVDVASTSTRELANLMVGRDVVFTGDSGVHESVADLDRIVLDVVGVSATNDRGTPALTNVNLQVHAGEIVGVCGVAGNGQKELAQVITGTRRRRAGTITVDGVPLAGRDPREAIEAGVAHVPEDRMRTGLAANSSIEDNVVLKSYRRSPMSSGPLIRRRRVRGHAEELIERFDVKTPGPRTPTRLLSGGNAQKVVLARELSAGPKLLIAASPTRGLDVGAIETVRELVFDAARAGTAVLLISETLDEVLAMSDRIIVLYNGTVAGDIKREDANVAELGLLMGGGARSSA